MGLESEIKKNALVKLSDKLEESKLCKYSFFGAYFAANTAVFYNPFITLFSNFAILATLTVSYYASTKYYKKVHKK